MAITVISDPNIIQPVYNPLYFVVSSNNTSQPNFNYLFNLYTGSTATGQPISTVNLLPRPDGTCIYNPARTLESYVGPDYGVQNIIDITGSTNMFSQYTVDIGEFYGGVPYSGLTDITAGIFNGVLQYTEIPTWSYTNYLITSSTGTTAKFLTNQPRSGVYVNATVFGTPFILDSGTVSFMCIPTIFHPYYARYVAYYQGLSFTSTTNDLAIHHAANDFIYHIPAGPANIDSAFSAAIIDEDTTHYTIQLLDNSKNPVSEAITYLVDGRCSKYTPVRLMFLNRYGAWDYMNFNMVSRKTVNATKRDMYKKNLAYNYTVGDRETTMINFDGNYTYTLNTDYITQGQSDWMEELFTSQNVNILNTDGTTYPVNITDGSIEIKKSINDKLLQYTFSLDSAYMINTQRG